jgi:hypothetical protein
MSAPTRNEARVRVSAGRIEGEFDFPHDPVFRPLVGIYRHGVLKSVIPAWRQFTDAGHLWRCRFEGALPADVPDLNELTVACTESGEVLHAPADDQISSGETGPTLVEEIVALGRRQASAILSGGFRSFLLLSIVDQISIFCLDFLGRLPDGDETELYCSEILAGKMTILDARDAIATCSDAQERYDRVVCGEPYGAWCLWDGFEDVIPFLLPPPRTDLATDLELGACCRYPLLRGFLELMDSREDLADTITRIAVGRDADIEQSRDWARAHDDLISELKASIQASSKRRKLLVSNPRSRYVRTNLAPAMTIGDVGTRSTEGTLVGRRGAAGVIAFGPYLRLEPGYYTLTYTMRVDGPVRPDPAATVEVVYGDVLFARHDMLAGSETAAACRLDFVVGAEEQYFIHHRLFEFRIRTSGHAKVEVDSLVLDVRTDLSARAQAPNVANWLLALLPGAAGERVQTGAIAANGKPGHVFYGPYHGLLPGDYSFGVTCDVVEEFSGRNVLLEAVAPNGMVLSRGEFSLSADENRLVIPVHVPVVAMIEDVLGPVEFRLENPSGARFVCTQANLELGK